MAASPSPAMARSVSGRAARARGGRAEGVEQEASELRGVGGGVGSGQQELEKLTVVDGLAPGAEEARAQFVVTGAGELLRCGRGERRHVVQAVGGHI